MVNGGYYDDDTTLVDPDKRTKIKENIDKLWSKSEELYKIQFKVE